VAPRPELWLLAGPNGVGKTTYAFGTLRALGRPVDFVNLDEIARGLSRSRAFRRGRRAGYAPHGPGGLRVLPEAVRMAIMTWPAATA